MHARVFYYACAGLRTRVLMFKGFWVLFRRPHPEYIPLAPFKGGIGGEIEGGNGLHELFAFLEVE